jgi:sensor histidine kinase YesM
MNIVAALGFAFLPTHNRMSELNKAVTNNRLYWKCQLLGWTGFTLVAILFNGIIYHDTREFIPFAISISILGIIVSHLIKLVILRLGILKKKFERQVIDLSIIAILFSFLGTYLWMAIMIKLGFWQIEAEGTGRNSSFLQAYFFNLFPVMLTLSGWVFCYFLYHYVTRARAEEKQKIEYKVQMIELEARALRAQMNPHFIFNCLNSIKSLIQDGHQDKSVTYLTTFSKLIRTLFQNADKKEISLYDEIETCKLYLQLEAMRFDAKFSYSINVDEQVDMKSIHIPALIIQPFIENAIWHGIVPKGNGGTVAVHITSKNEVVEISIDDDGIGREASLHNKAKTHVTHNSKGLNLTQSRLELDNSLRDRNAQIIFIDKKDEKGTADGTKVIISLPAEV